MTHWLCLEAVKKEKPYLQMDNFIRYSELNIGRKWRPGLKLSPDYMEGQIKGNYPK